MFNCIVLTVIKQTLTAIILANNGAGKSAL
jgi:hypothetical protein